VGDESLRDLERAVAASDAPEPRFRYATALAREGRAPEALQVLAPVLERRDGAGHRARIHAAAIYLEAGEGEAATAVLSSSDFDDDARREYASIAARLEALLEVPEVWGAAARAIGKVAPLEELVRVFRSAPGERTHTRIARSILASEIQKRDKARARELADEEADPGIKMLLRAQGTLLV
jgi:hypothetical protein